MNGVVSIRVDDTGLDRNLAPFDVCDLGLD
jgi:hypothetical protein